MRRSSKVVLALALALLLALGFLYVRSLDTDAPPLTPRVASQLLERGERAFEHRSVEGIMELVAPRARLFGRNPDQLRLVLARAFQEMGPNRITADRRNLIVEPMGDTGTASFDVRIGERGGGADVLYYDLHVSLDLVKVRVPHWLGLYTTEEWKVSRAESIGGLDLPDL